MMILTCRSILNLNVSFVTAVVLYADAVAEWSDTLISVISAVMILDFVLHLTGAYRLDKDMIIHHVLVLIFSVVTLSNEPEVRSHPTFLLGLTTLLRVEISTIFLSILYLSRSLPQLPRWALTLNKVMFVTSFFWFRIYVYFVDLFSNRLMLAIRDAFPGGWWCAVAFIGLFLLNLYWGVLILRKFACSRAKLTND